VVAGHLGIAFAGGQLRGHALELGRVRARARRPHQQLRLVQEALPVARIAGLEQDGVEVDDLAAGSIR
jgi:hypothetical protein